MSLRASGNALPGYPSGREPGAWARRAAPRWCLTAWDVGERLGVCARQARYLADKYQIPISTVSRPVRLSDGRLVKRKITLFTPTALQELLAVHAGLRRPP